MTNTSAIATRLSKCIHHKHQQKLHKKIFPKQHFSQSSRYAFKFRCTSQPANVPIKKSEDIYTEATGLKPLIILENIADDPSLQNPLLRLERMGTGWFGVIFDFEGVMISDCAKVHIEAWLKLAAEEGKKRPLQYALKRATQMKAEQAISEVLCWGREPGYVRRMAMRKEEIFLELLGDNLPPQIPGIHSFMEMLAKHNIPIAVCSTERQLVHKILPELDVYNYISEIITADDVSRCIPDPEAYAYAASRIDRPPFRCVVIGASNHSCEAAHDCGMQSVAVTGDQQPLYELNAADLVIKSIDKLSLINLKNLFTLEEGIEPLPEPETLPESYFV